jgi:hypothetical protein
MVFIKILLIILGVYWLGKWILKSIFSYFLGSASEDINAQMRRQQEEMLRKKKKKEGNVTINYQPKSDKNFRKEEGDYVDFEEIK